MISCGEEPLVEPPPGPRWWEEAKHCPSRQRDRIIRRRTRTLNFDVQAHYGPIAYPCIHPRVGPMGRLIDLEYLDGFEKAAQVADLWRVSRARERSRARPLAV